MRFLVALLLLLNSQAWAGFGAPGEMTIVITALPLPPNAAKETTQLSVLSAVQSIDTDFDVALSTRASEATLLGVNTRLDTLIAKDFATSAKQDLQTTQLIAINTNTDQLETYLDGVEALLTAGNGFLTSIDSKIPSGLTVSTGRLLVDGSGVVQPVSQSGAWSIGRTWTLNSATDSVTELNSTSILSSVDGIETLISSTNSALTTGIATMLDKHASGSLVSPDITSVIGPIATNGAASISVYFSGTWSGSIVVEVTAATAPGASDWTAIRMHNDISASPQNPVTTAGLFTSNQIAGKTFVRVRRSNAGTGTAVIEMNVSAAPGAVRVTSLNANDLITSATQSGTWTVQQGNTPSATPWTQNLTQVGGAAVTLGQKTMANSIPVVLSSDQSTINVSGTITSSGGALETTQLSVLAAVDGLEALATAGNASTASIDTDIDVALSTRASAANQTTIIGHVDGIEASLTSIDSKLTSPLAVSNTETRASGATVTSVSGTITSTTLLASNANRRQMIFFNDSSAVLYLKFGATASSTSFTVRLDKNQLYEAPNPVYSGIVDGVWASASGAVRITEVF